MPNHSNTPEEAENVDYPKDPAFCDKFGPRDSIHPRAKDTVDETTDPRFGIVGKQKIKSTGQVTRKRMETYNAITAP